MILRTALKKILPSSTWNYMKRTRYNFLLSMMHRLLGGFVILESWEKFDKSGKKIFDGEQYYSQAYQDYFLDKYIFNRKESGFFLDIGGNDPIKINNTYFFEKNRNWTGLAFEPIKTQREKWELRKTECLPYALGDSAGEAEFCEYKDHEMSGLTGITDYNGDINLRCKVPIRRLADILDERKIKHVDFVSLDVEGAEISVLNGIDFSRVSIDCFTIENNKGPAKEKRVIDFMMTHGYKLKAKLWLDEVWIKD